MKNAVQRILTALVVIPLVVGLFWLTSKYQADWAVCLFLSVVAVVAGWEYLNLVAKLGIPLPRELFLFSAVAFLMLLVPWEGKFSLVLAWGFAYLIVMYSFFRRGAQLGFYASLAGIFGFLYIPGMLAMVYFMYRGGFWFVLHFLLIMWGYDSGAYFVGSALGRHRLLPRISLAKTWEGVGGGLILAIVGAAIFPEFWQDFCSWLPHVALLGASVGAFGQLGDLFESLVKRAAGVKDTGCVFPGHGGMLDRIDSILAAAPVYVFYMHYVLNLLPLRGNP